MRRRCPTTGKDVTDPMLCLFCGDIFCGQSICCLKEEGGTRNKPASQIGGAQQHMRKYVYPPISSPTRMTNSCP
jgi:E3 ubiquitin-protein ligase UBR1